MGVIKKNRHGEGDNIEKITVKISMRTNFFLDTVYQSLPSILSLVWTLWLLGKITEFYRIYGE